MLPIFYPKVTYKVTENGQKYPELPEDMFWKVLNLEGGYVFHPADPGGETNRGITFNTLNAAKKLKLIPEEVTIRDLTERLDYCYTIYNNMYYKRYVISSYPAFLSFAHFDATVNHGAGNSAMFMQKAINTFKDMMVDVDRKIVPMTRDALFLTLERVPVREFTEVYCDVREQFYYAIGKKEVPGTGKTKGDYFLRGWLNRLKQVREFCGIKG